MSAPPLPELFRGTCDAAQLRALFADLASHAEVLKVRLKDGPKAYAGSSELGLGDARDALAAGEVSGAQVTYRWADQLWIDTFLVGGAPRGGARVVRMPVLDVPGEDREPFAPVLD